MKKIFLDTNILKFSVVKQIVRVPREDTINWGGVEHTTVVYDTYRKNTMYGIKSDPQRKDTALLPFLAFAGINRQVKFYINSEVQFEAWGLPRMHSVDGVFFGCPIENVEGPANHGSRVFLGAHKTKTEWTQHFFQSIQDRRFKELCKATGGFQGKNKPLNINQARDAYFIWSAEALEADYFLTMDYKLMRILEARKIELSVEIVTPYQCFMKIGQTLGLIRGLRWIWGGYKFAKQRVGFSEERLPPLSRE